MVTALGNKRFDRYYDISINWKLRLINNQSIDWSTFPITYQVPRYISPHPHRTLFTYMHPWQRYLKASSTLFSSTKHQTPNVVGTSVFVYICIFIYSRRRRLLQNIDWSKGKFPLMGWQLAREPRTRGPESRQARLKKVANGERGGFWIHPPDYIPHKIIISPISKKFSSLFERFDTRISRSFEYKNKSNWPRHSEQTKMKRRRDWCQW